MCLAPPASGQTASLNQVQPLLPTVKNAAQRWCLADLKGDPRWTPEVNRLSISTSTGNGPGGGTLTSGSLAVNSQRDPRFNASEQFGYEQLCNGYQLPPRQLLQVQEAAGNGTIREVEGGYQKSYANVRNSLQPLRCHFRPTEDQDRERLRDLGASPPHLNPAQAVLSRHLDDTSGGHTSSEGGSSPEHWEHRRPLGIPNTIKDGES